ncbi:DNA-binding response regulator [Bifidobacterium sp. DSM 109957]|uniref:DNA-binding response regulator n=2 Tax=Bifidobacterium oedipodis TaxID=2675322 RepID=A0A7Y0EQS6_9BIFI|nr:DNA-binding response regulator [Bifidobacterium sp. DSM 109957]
MAGDISIGVVDNDRLSLRALSMVLGATNGICVLWGSTLGMVAVRRCMVPSTCPQVLVVDMAMEDMSGLELCTKIRHHASNVALVCVTSYSLALYEEDASNHGAQALVSKTDFDGIRTAISNGAIGVATQRPGSMVVFDDVAEANRQVARGNGAAPLLRAKGDLSPRELRTMRLYAEGANAGEIASLLNVRVSTVHTFEKRAMSKLGAKTRSQAIAMCIRKSLW